MTSADPFWRVVRPDKWPDPPTRFSYSALKEIETCARRWALTRGDYSASLGRKGYPRKPREGTLAGEVAHLALQKIATALQTAGCMGPDDPAVVAALRGLGGLSAVLESCTGEVMGDAATNPRAAHRMEHLRSDLMRRLPELRHIVQGALQRIFGVTPSMVPIDRWEKGSGQGSKREALQPGFHAEVELAPHQLSWVGWADVIKLTAESCEIIDYKTGAKDPAHFEQLRIYALLWLRDEELNPEALPATNLTVVYPGTIYTVPPPSPSEIKDLESELKRRADAGRAALRGRPPRASVGADACRFCNVKHLCDDYWTPRGQQLVREASWPAVRSVQVEVLQPRGARSWLVVVHLDPYLAAGTRALLTAQEMLSLQEGHSIRLVDAWIQDRTEDGLPAIRLGSNSEIYRLP